MAQPRRTLRSALTVAVCAAVSLPAAAVAETWTQDDGSADRNRVSSIFPGLDLATAWKGSPESTVQGGDDRGPDACVLVDEDRVYAVHGDLEDSSVSRLVALDRDSGALAWQSPPFGGVKPACPVLADGLVVVATGYSPSLPATGSLRAYDAATGEEGWSTPLTTSSISSALSSDGTRVYASGHGFPGCADGIFSTHGAWDLATGQPVWCIAGDQTQTAPLITEGVVVFGTRSDAGLTAVDAVDGSPVWSDPSARGGHTVAADGGQIAYSMQDTQGPNPTYLYGVRLRTADGTQVWQRLLPSGQAAGPVILDGTRVYLGAHLMNGGNLRVRALHRSSGADVWPQSAQAESGWSEFTLAGNRIVFGSSVVDTATGVVSGGYWPRVAPWMASFVDGTMYGWVTNSGGTFSVGAVRDTTDPLLGDLSPAAGAATSDTTPTFSFSASDGAGSGVTLLELVLDGVRHDVTGETSWSPTEPLAEGPHTWSLVATDGVGNQTSSTPRTLFVDSTPPGSFSITSPTSEVGTGTPTITWTASDDGTGSGIDHYSVLVKGVKVAEVPGGCAPTCEAVPSAPLPDGTYALEVRAVDGAGLTRSATAELVVAAPPVARLTAATLLTLTGTSIDLDATESSDNDPGALSYAWSVDGGPFETGTALHDVAFGSAGQHVVAVRVTGAGPLSDRAEATIDVRRMPPAGEVGVSVNGGAYATNDPNVSVSVIWRKLDSRVRLSNDGGFGDGSSSFEVAPKLDWTLVTEGSERLPRTVYARLSGRPDAEDRDLTDDIVLDTTAPSVESASVVSGRVVTRSVTARAVSLRAARTVRVRVRAADSAAGVRGFQVTSDRSRPGKILKITRARKVSTTLKATVTGRLVYVRAVDAAGNTSGWRRAG